MQTLHLDIVTPEGSIFSGDIKGVILPGKEGEFGVLPGHSTLVTPLRSGIIDIENKNQTHDIIAINWGYCEVDEVKVSILADGAVYVGGNSHGEIAKSIEKAKDLIKSIGSDNITFANVCSKIDSVLRS